MTERAIESYPLTPTQQGILFNSLRAGAVMVEIEQIVARLHHTVDIPRLTAAWAWASERHAVLRTSFRWDDGDPRQLVHPHAPLPFVVRDDAGSSAADRERNLARFLVEDRERGFDLAKAPIARLTLFVHGPQEHVLVWTFHHALLDGRSFTQVLREVFDRYDALGGHGAPYDPPAPPPFRLHCEHLAQRDPDADEAFWAEHLRGLSAPTPLPCALPGDRAKSAPDAAARARHGELEIPVGAPFVKRLSDLGREHGFTLANAVQGAWAVSLARHARTDDVCFGSTRAARHTSVPEALDMVGCLINTVPVRVAVPPEMDALDLLRNLREINVATRPHEQASLVSMRGWAGLPPGAPLFETLVVFERYLMDTELRARGAEWDARQFSVLEQSDFPLVLAAYQDGDDLILKLEHDPVRCDSAAVARLVAHLATILRAISKNPLAKIAALPLLTDEERSELLAHAGGDGALASFASATWPEAFVARAHATPEACALRGPTGDLTYAALDRMSGAVAARLDEAGVGRGDVVAVCASRSPLLAASLIGVLRAGAVYLPIDPAWPADRIAMILEDSRARVVLAQDITRRCLPAGLDAKAIVLDAPGALDRQPAEDVRIDPESPAYVLYTSGSTGRPKGVVVPHRALMAHARAITPAFELSERDRCLQFTSPSFDVSLEEMLPTWLAGACVVLRSEAAATSIDVFLRELEERAVTVVNVPSAFFTEIAIHSHEARVAMPASVRLVVVGGEKPSAVAYARWRQLHPGVRFLNAYGPTEVTITSTYCDPERAGVPADGLTELPIGRGLGACRAYVLDTSGDLAPLGVPGELCLAGPQVALGYLHRPDLTALRFGADPFAPSASADRMYRTGDLVRLLPSGQLEFCGRVDEQVKIRGFRIEPGEIEVVLRSDARVRDAVVTARPDRSGSQRLLAWVVPASEPLDDATLRAICTAKLPSYMVPSAFSVLESLPLTPSGKVDKRALPEPDDTRDANAFVQPQGELEPWIATLFGELLGRHPISADANFFELGGHSLLAVRLISKINARARDPLELGVIFAHPTVRGLARALASGVSGSLPTVVALNEAPVDAVPLFCICGVQLYAQLARAMEADRPVYGVFLEAEAEAISGGDARLDVPSMAAAYIDLIRAQRPRGPYLLGGVSFGGILAYEMAQQLTAQGESVALVALFDAILPRALHKASPVDRAKEYARRLREGPRAFGEHMHERMVRHMARIAGPAAVPMSDRAQTVAVDLLRDELFLSASKDYDRSIRPYDGKVSLFRAADGLGVGAERVEDDRGWSSLVPATSAVHVVPGTHLGILSEPGVFEIARCLRTDLRGLEERQITRRTRRVSTSRITIPPGAMATAAPREREGH